MRKRVHGLGAPRAVRLRMPSARATIPPMIDKILRAIKPAGFGRGQRDDLAIALAEALANAVIHGNRMRPRAQVSIQVEVDPGKGAAITVKDSGAGFKPESLPDPGEPSNLLIPRGRGVFLMRSLMDAVDYNAKGNQVRLTLKRRSRRRAA